MGTNYYAECHTCPVCKKPRYALHIGKSSWGWTFSFKAHDASGAPEEAPEDLSIQSWKDWEKFLTTSSVIIKDEYGSTITLDELKDIIFEDDRPSKMKRHADSYPTGNFKDSDGHSFSRGEFS